MVFCGNPGCTAAQPVMLPVGNQVPSWGRATRATDFASALVSVTGWVRGRGPATTYEHKLQNHRCVLITSARSLHVYNVLRPGTRLGGGCAKMRLLRLSVPASPREMPGTSPSTALRQLRPPSGLVQLRQPPAAAVPGFF